tara:strand:- start:309 stop:1124 length:816 start_codon:yes stop_codon:yes gene_type:complete
MRILILGSRGMLGSICTQYFSNTKHKVEIFDRHFSFENYDQYLTDFKSYSPEIIINCIGKIKQKTDSFSDLMSINAVLPNLIALHKPKNAILIQPSTDCVFSGDLKKELYEFDDLRDAKDAYGMSKLFGESVINDRKGVLILRGSIIGLVKGKSSSLMDWFLGHSDEDTVNGYQNHYWNGITTLQWCKSLELILEDDTLTTVGLLQFGTDNCNSKYDLLNKINIAFKRTINVNPVRNEEDINRCLRSNLPHRIPSIEKQLEELHLFLSTSQ